MKYRHCSERRKELKRKLEEENKKRADRVREIEKKVESFALGTEKEFGFDPVEKEWRAIQWVLSSLPPHFWTSFLKSGHFFMFPLMLSSFYACHVS